MLVVAYEGIAGFLMWLVLLPIFQFIPCDIESVCTNGVIEDTWGVFEDFQANPVLLGFSLFLIFDVCILNIAGVSITKYGSAAQRTTCSMVMNAFVWIFYIFVPVGKTESGGPRYIEAFTWLQFAGFMVLVF